MRAKKDAAQAASLIDSYQFNFTGFLIGTGSKLSSHYRGRDW